MINIKDIIVKKIHETVVHGELGVDYTFDNERDKNRALRRKYKVNDDKMREILLKIKTSHYVKSEQSTNKEHPDDTVHVFKLQEKLMPRFVEDADYVSVCIYIKITWPNGKEPLFIISFHEDES